MQSDVDQTLGYCLEVTLQYVTSPAFRTKVSKLSEMWRGWDSYFSHNACLQCNTGVRIVSCYIQEVGGARLHQCLSGKKCHSACVLLALLVCTQSCEVNCILVFL